MAAELLGNPVGRAVPAPAVSTFAGPAATGQRVAPGAGIRGRLRDSIMRALTARSVKEGARQRSTARVQIGLPARDPGPLRR